MLLEQGLGVAGLQVAGQQQDRGLGVPLPDDGRGAQALVASLANSRGLRGLADRIEVAGGIMSVASAPGGPTRINAEIPPR